MQRWFAKEKVMRHAAKCGKVVPETPELRKLLKWAETNGAFWPKVRFSVRFDPGYFGVQATNTIRSNETIISVPRKLVITPETVDRSELKPIIDANKRMFRDRLSEWTADFKLIMFLLYEDAKGAHSVWDPYLRTLPREHITLASWPDPLLSELQDPVLVAETKRHRAALRRRWKELSDAVLQHPSLFQRDMITFEKFHWAEQILCTRAFGVRVSSLCPVADFVNHSNSQTFYSFGHSTDPPSTAVFTEDEDLWPDEMFTPSLPNLATAVCNLHNLPPSDSMYISVTAAEKSEAKRPKKTRTSVLNHDDMRIVAGEREVYATGAEVCLNYGARSNRALLSDYGFALEEDDLAYDPLQLRVGDFLLGNQAVWTFKVRKDVLCGPLLSAIRALLWKPGTHSLESALDVGDPALDQAVTATYKRLVEQRLASFPTSAEEDLALFSSSNDIRLTFALRYRRQRKLILQSQFSALAKIIIA